MRLGLEVSGAEITERIRQLRAQMERIRDQVDLEPAGAAQQQAAAEQSRLARRLKEIADKAGRGGDVGGLLGPLEIDAATFERDLIVGGARRREAAALVRRARDLRAELEAREAALRDLVAECVRRVDPAPRYAVPDVERSVRCPTLPTELDGYLRRLDQVGRAMAMAEQAYARRPRRAPRAGRPAGGVPGQGGRHSGWPTYPTLPRRTRWRVRPWTGSRAGWSSPRSWSPCTRPTSLEA